MRSIVLLTLLLLPGGVCLAGPQFDGHYIGQRTVVRGAGHTCPANGPAAWQIANGQFDYRIWAGNVPVKVSDDGKLEGKMMYTVKDRHWWVTVSGTISDGSLEADAEWRACQLHFSLKKQ